MQEEQNLVPAEALRCRPCRGPSTSLGMTTKKSVKAPERLSPMQALPRTPEIDLRFFHLMGTAFPAEQAKSASLRAVQRRPGGQGVHVVPPMYDLSVLNCDNRDESVVIGCAT